VLTLAPPAASTSPADAQTVPQRECGGQPCCGDPPRPCGSGPGPQRAKTGAIVVEQVVGSCTVFVDGKKWPEGGTLKAVRVVPAGMHTVDCRAASGATLFSRRLEVDIGRENAAVLGAVARSSA